MSISQTIRNRLLQNARERNFGEYQDNEDNEDYEDIVGQSLSMEIQGGRLGDRLSEIEVKSTGSFSNDLNDAIKTVVNDKKHAEVFGSFMYRAQSFPGDVDIHEVIDMCCSAKDAAKKMASILKKIVKRIKDHRGYYFSEVKSGNDLRFELDVDDPKYLENLHHLYESKLVDEEEYKLLKDKERTTNNDAKEAIKEYIRNLYVLRWTQEEVLQGYKILRGNKKITLAESMNMPGHIKIDMLAPINGRYNEITNFFVLAYHNKDDDYTYINIDPSKFNYVNAILEQIFKLSSKTYLSPFKLSKRMWGLSRHLKNEKMLELLTPLMQSGIARMNQIKSEIEVIQLILEKVKQPPMATLKKQIDEFKSRLAYVYDVSLGEQEQEIYSIIDEIVNGNIKVKNIGKYLEIIKDILKKKINSVALEFLKKNGLYPVTKNILDKFSMKHTGNIFRQIKEKNTKQNDFFTKNMEQFKKSRESKDTDKLGIIDTKKSLKRDIDETKKLTGKGYSNRVLNDRIMRDDAYRNNNKYQGNQRILDLQRIELQNHINNNPQQILNDILK